MWFPVSTIAALCVLLDVSDTSRSDNELELVFRDRSQSDWEEAWHKEKYTRCRETLIRHLYWACEKDIYRLTRRSDQNTFNNNFLNDVDDAVFKETGSIDKKKSTGRFKKRTPKVDEEVRLMEAILSKSIRKKTPFVKRKLKNFICEIVN
ncbi:insulin-like peptide 7 [Asbolus verrucosus]|uniref:Insulin-like peptide 7 n=1 Tax=Asbolus verrucosus TaxID=1661398 RepID=A0A482VQ36_ASBVE|nr:insulin-like peptide 7 [Asbolus verrucosus]